MQQFSLVYNNLLVILEPVDELWSTYDCGQLTVRTFLKSKIGGGPELVPGRELVYHHYSSSIVVSSCIDGLFVSTFE